MLQRFVDLASRATRLDLLKPRIRENDFSAIQTESDGMMTVHNARFKTRIRSSTQVQVQLKNGDIIDAKIKGSQGRRSSAVPGKSLKGDDISRIRVIGREERTPAEQAQYYFLLSSLTATRRIPLFVDVIWFPGKTQEIVRDEEINLSNNYAYRILENLNNSQRGVVDAMLSTATRNSLVIAHGPPGTGKTTTIAAAAAIWVSHRQPCWIIAQSNVGVKNIAETLFKKEVKFRLIVSKDFLFEWHEDLYVEIERMVIRSDELISQRDVTVEFHDVTVVLCTVSMLSNPTLDSCGLFRVVPVRSLVIDEASQIDIFEFMHLFYKFSKTLMKVCFFGDPKQLPPYGAEDADLETIFEVKHLKKSAYFLDTQYRLPVRLGEFISMKVYHGKLRSHHKIMDYSCISFIDVQKGEESKQGSSWKNMEEVHMVVRIAGLYKQRGLNFCIITFYDPQRAAIAKALEAAKLPSAYVYNVDSFQ
ncbi:P-loop containing nucleoside triphosphate hydrolase protein, partial [Russula compacta]